jgi:hypothetical protein
MKKATFKIYKSKAKSITEHPKFGSGYNPLPEPKVDEGLLTWLQKQDVPEYRDIIDQEALDFIKQNGKIKHKNNGKKDN